MALAPLFGPPLESAFDEQKTEGRKNMYPLDFFFSLKYNLPRVKASVLSHVPSDPHGKKSSDLGVLLGLEFHLQTSSILGFEILLLEISGS